MYDDVTAIVAEYDTRLDVELQTLRPEDREDEPCPPHPNRSKAKTMKTRGELPCARRCGASLALTSTTIDGIGAENARTILTGIGFDIAKFPTEKHFVSWLRLCPRVAVSGGKPLKKRCNGMGASRLAAVFRNAAVTLSRSKSALGAAYRRQASRHSGRAPSLWSLASSRPSCIACFDSALTTSTSGKQPTRPATNTVAASASSEAPPNSVWRWSPTTHRLTQTPPRWSRGCFRSAHAPPLALSQHPPEAAQSRVGVALCALCVTRRARRLFASVTADACQVCRQPLVRKRRNVSSIHHEGVLRRDGGPHARRPEGGQKGPQPLVEQRRFFLRFAGFEGAVEGLPGAQETRQLRRGRCCSTRHEEPRGHARVVVAQQLNAVLRLELAQPRQRARRQGIGVVGSIPRCFRVRRVRARRVWPSAELREHRVE
ncbi:MAG: IS110 family transposase [Sandaracinaceae bacterium]|nr:IS110 family transposase [Sandaracinaceae bacterium]